MDRAGDVDVAFEGFDRMGDEAGWRSVPAGASPPRCPSRAKYFSVDGYHRAEFVINDLMIAQDVICDGGVVIVDDYLSPLVGVTEGVSRYLLQNAHQKIAPFAYGENKLLMTTIIKRRAYFNHFRKLHPKLVSKIGGYLCAGINPDDKWFKSDWTNAES